MCAKLYLSPPRTPVAMPHLISLSNIAHSHHSGQDSVAAVALLDQVLTIAERTQDNSVKERALIEVTYGLYHIGAYIKFSSETVSGEDIQPLLNRVLLATRELDNTGVHATIYMGIADVVSGFPEPMIMDELLVQFSDVVSTLESPRARVDGLSAIAKIYSYSINDESTARDYLRQALAQVNQIEHGDDRMFSLHRIMFLSLSPHDWTASSSLLSQGLQTINTEQDESTLANGIVAISSFSGSTLDTPEGQTLFNDLLVSAERLEDNWNQTEALSTLARAVAEIAPENSQ